MKNIFKVLIILVIGALTFSACDKEPDLPWGSFDDMEYANDFYIYNFSWTDDTINTVLPAGDAPVWQNTVVISKVRGEAQNVDLYVYFYNGSDWSGPFDLATGITAFPHTKALTSQDLISVIPAYNGYGDFVAGHQYTFGLRITTSEGLEYQTNEIIGGVMRSKLGGNIRNYPGANFNLNLRAIDVCGVADADILGNWNVVEWSDRWSEEAIFPATMQFAADGETMNFFMPDQYYLWAFGFGALPVQIIFDKSNPYAWVPSLVGDIIGRTTHPYDVAMTNNDDYDRLFSSCDLEIFIGYQVDAINPASGALLGQFDWGSWVLTKVAKKSEGEVNYSSARLLDVVNK